MTAQRDTRMPGQRRPADLRRRSVVYGIPTLPVDQNPQSPTYGMVIPNATPIVGYIGKSVQTVYQRQEQHRDDQPFSDTICGGSWVIEEGWWTDAELAAKEEWWISNGVALVPGGPRQRPVYNYEFNTENPDRVKVWRAREQRQIREPGWAPPAHGERVPRQRGAAGAAVWEKAVRQWSPRVLVRLLAAALFGGWAWPVAASGPVADWLYALGVTAALTAVLFGAPVAVARDVRAAARGKRPRRRRRARR